MFYLFIKDNYSGSKKLSLLVIAVNGLIFAILTELIQLLSPGRDGNVNDVLLDYFGYTISFIICIIIVQIYYFIASKKKNNKKDIDNDKSDELTS